MSLLSNDEKVLYLQQHWAEGATDLKAFEGLLVEVIESGAWESFHTPNGVVVEPPSFRQFIIAERFDGLGATPEKITALLGDKNDAVVRMRNLLKAKTGPKPSNNSGNNITSIGRVTTTGTRRDYALDRLTRERPDLRTRVDAGELSAHAAAVEAGFRKRTITVRTDDPISIAASLRRNLKPNVIQSLIELLETG